MSEILTKFFYFDDISKMRILQQKTLLLKGAKNHWVKKVIKSKNDFSKSCPKFCKLGDNFFILTKIKKALQASYTNLLKNGSVIT